MTGAADQLPPPADRRTRAVKGVEPLGHGMLKQHGKTLEQCKESNTHSWFLPKFLTMFVLAFLAVLRLFKVAVAFWFPAS